MPTFIVEGVRGRPEMVPFGGDATRPSTTASLTGAIAATPGLVLQESGDGFYPPRVTVRGSGLQSAPVSRGLVLRLDTLPFNAADGSFNLALLEPGFFCASTFLPGANDSAAAVQALGGSLDLSWWRSLRETQSDLAITAGSDGFVHAVARAENGQPYGPHSTYSNPFWAGAVAFTRSDGWRSNSEQERTALAGRAEWSTLGGSSHSLSVYAARADLCVSGPLTLAVAQQNPASITAAAAADLPRRSTDYARVVYRATWKDGFEAALGVQATDDEFRQLRANGISNTRGGDVLGRVAGEWRIVGLKIMSGMLGAVGERRQERFTNVGGRPGSQFADLRLRAQTLTAWTDAEWKPARLVSVKGGFSVLAARRQVRGTATAEGTVSADEIAPRIEIAAFPSQRRLVEVFVRAARGAETPTFDDLLTARGAAPNLALGWSQLRLQTADTLEAGIRGRFGERDTGNDWISFECTAYTADWHNELLRLADANGAALGTVNAGPTRHRGIESAVRWRLLNGERTLDLAVTHTRSDARFEHDPVNGDNHLAGLPPHAGSAQLTFAQKEGVFAVAGASWIWGRTYADHGNRLSYSGHTLANAKLGWKAQRWRFGVEVNNLLNRRYIASTSGVIDLARTPATTALFLPGSPRAFIGSFEYRW